MKPWIVLLAFLAVAHSQRIISIQRIPLFSAASSGPTCEDKCSKTYPTDEKSSNGIKSCETGCRLLSLIETVDASPFGGKSKPEDALSNCDKSCEASFEKDNDEKACKEGCKNQLPIAQERRNSMNSALDNFFGDSGFPKIQMGFPSVPESSGLSNMFNSMPDFSDMFERMHSHMNDVMKNFMKQGEGENIPAGGKGRMVVIKSGPGYHEEKTVDFGPDGVHTEVKSNGKPIENDMMNKMNPIERFFKKDLVDIFNPKPESQAENEAKEDEDEIKKVIKNVISDRIDQEKSKPVFDVEIKPQSNSIHGFDFEGPRLPDEGLRTRFIYPRHMQLVCSQNSDEMKWSDWVSCLHLRMGLPRWLTAATISLGIVFIIWLCLVIPQNAPKQKVKMTKAMEAAGQIEKERMNIIMANPVKLDLPPSYEDIANLHVAIPITSNQQQAEALPEKKKPETEERA